MKPKFFYGWIVALISALGAATSVAVFIPATMGILAGPLHAEFGWSLKAIFLSVTYTVVPSIAVAMFVGAAVLRFGARRVLAFSFIAEALIMASFYWLDSALPGLYLRYAAFGILCTGTTAITFATLITRWFDRRRGLALGIMLAGVGVGGVFWSLMSQKLIEQLGWRMAMPAMAAIVLFIVLPVILLLVRDTPQSMGLLIDGDHKEAPQIDAPQINTTHATLPMPSATTGLSMREAIATPQYWLMLLTFMLIGTGIYSVMLHLVPLLKAQGASAQTAALVQASSWAVLIIGRLSTGWLMDRFFAPRVASGFLLLAALGVVVLALGAQGSMAVVGAMLVGLAAGAEVDVVAYLTSRYFGLKHYSVIYSTFFTAYAIGNGIGPVITGLIVERSDNNYGPALWAITGLFVIALVLLTLFRPYAKPALNTTASSITS